MAAILTGMHELIGVGKMIEVGYEQDGIREIADGLRDFIGAYDDHSNERLLVGMNTLYPTVHRLLNVGPRLDGQT